MFGISLLEVVGGRLIRAASFVKVTVDDLLLKFLLQLLMLFNQSRQVSLQPPRDVFAHREHWSAISIFEPILLSGVQTIQLFDDVLTVLPLFYALSPYPCRISAAFMRVNG